MRLVYSQLQRTQRANELLKTKNAIRSLRSLGKPI
jgi:hypothetical protein